MALALIFAATACKENSQSKAYDRATEREQHFTTEAAPAIVAQYQAVIRIEPNSAWATRAKRRIEAVQARLTAEEQHKAVFQEHGVD